MRVRLALPCLVLGVAAALLGDAAAAPRDRPARCPDGAYVGPGPLVPGDAQSAVITLDGRRVMLGGCGSATARTKRRDDGWHVRARWRRCGAARRVRLHGVIAPGACRAMGGTLRTGDPGGTTALALERAARVLAFSRTTGFRHPSIADAQRVLGALAPTDGVVATLTEDPAAFTDERLAPFDVVLFANTTGDVLNPDQQGAMERFVRAGRGFVGVHSAADTEYAWPWYGRLVGAYFTSHPLLPVRVDVTTEDDDHPSTAHLPPVFSFVDEIYNFDRNPRLDNAILLTVDEAGFVLPNFPPGPSMGADHPIAWYKEFEGGRSFYTNLGHRPETWDDPTFRAHLLGGIRWAAAPAAWSRIVLTEEAANPMALAVAPDGRVFYVERTGEVRAWDPATGRVRLAAHLDVDTSAENGLLGVAVDPHFAENRFLYLYHSVPPADPPPPGPPGRNTLSRFVVRDDGTLDPASRTDLLAVPSERECCHEAGAIAFGPDGSLFLSVGDNTDPFGDSGGFAPLDARPGRERWDARRTAQNPFDLRGKILRIRPDGSIPPGNLFPADGSLGRPEIYTMGSRNPFRIAVDPLTGRLWWGEVGPDAVADTSRGPRGYDEINLADVPGNYGWPYCIAENRPYADWDYGIGSADGAFSCDGYVPAVLAYDYLTVRYPPLGNALPPEGPAVTGRTAIAGTVYRPARPDAPAALPPSLDGTLVMTEWTRDLVLSLAVDDGGQLRRLRRLLPWERFLRPIDVEAGPDGALYVLEYGSGFAGDNPDAKLTRIEYAADGVRPPVAHVTASGRHGAAPFTVELSGEGSRPPGDGDEIVDWAWDLDGDGDPDAHGPVVRETFRRAGRVAVSLVVETRSGRRSFPATVDLLVGNTPPAVEVLEPADGTTVTQGTRVRLRGRATDAEDGPVPCASLAWDVSLGHNAHAHPVTTLFGCDQTFVARVPDHHGTGGGLFFVFELRHTDAGGPGDEPGLTGRSAVRLDVVPGPPGSPSGAFVEAL